MERSSGEYQELLEPRRRSSAYEQGTGRLAASDQHCGDDGDGFRQEDADSRHRTCRRSSPFTGLEGLMPGSPSETHECEVVSEEPGGVDVVHIV